MRPERSSRRSQVRRRNKFWAGARASPDPNALAVSFATGHSQIIRSLRRLVTRALVLLALQPLNAATDAEREFDQLTQERDRALAQVSEPIVQKYEAAITALMRKAAVADDLDTAVRIKETLAKIAEGRAKATIIGKWDFLNRADGHTAPLEFNSDKTFSAEGKRLGVWDVKGKEMIVTFDNREVGKDVYNLPIHDGELNGTNRHGHALVLKRRSE
jgi:hypothetical protein